MKSKKPKGTGMTAKTLDVVRAGQRLIKIGKPEAAKCEQTEYRRLDRWRAAWKSLAANNERGSLQIRQDRIDRRAMLCDQKIRVLMRAIDRRVGNTFNAV